MKLILSKILMVMMAIIILFSCDPEIGLFEPDILISTPEMYEVVNDTVIIYISVKGDYKIEKVELWVNGLNTEQYDDTKPYSIGFITDAYEDGIISLFIRAYRKDGDYYDSSPLIIEIDNHPNFTNFTPTNSPLSRRGVEYLDVTSDGTVWVGDKNNLYKYKNGIWDVIIFPDSILYAGKYIDNIVVNNDTIWVGVGEYGDGWWKILKIFDSNIIQYDVDCFDYSWFEKMIIDRQNRLWIVTGYAKLILFENQTFKIWKESDHWSDSTHMFRSDDGSMGGLAIDEDNTIWIAGFSHSLGFILTHFDENVWEVYNIPDFDGGRVSGLTIDTEGNKWISSHGQGFAKMASDLSWTIYNTTNSDLPSANVQGIYIDYDGIFWTGTQNSGIISFNPGANVWNCYTPHNSDQLFEYIQFIDGDGTTIWGGANGFYASAAGLVKITVPK